MAILASASTEIDSPRLVVSFEGGELPLPADPNAIAELVQRIVSSGPVDQLRVEGAIGAADVRQLVELARLTGRPLRLPACPAGDLPAALEREEWRSEGAGWRLSRRPRPAAGRAAKRAIDVAGSLLGLLMLSPLLLALALAVRLDSRGPIFYRWRVLGLYGRPFTGYKFRSMVVGADAMKAEMLAMNEMKGPVFKMANDPRITRLGRFLRKYSLDELPQLWSVLKGDMSLVGPRPPSPSEYRSFDLWQLRKLSVTPGITCLWQVNGRNFISDFSEWARLDLAYIDNWSFRLDLRILVLTVKAVFGGTGR